MIKVAYIVSRFPHFYQTFIRRELDAVAQQGGVIEIFTLAEAGRGRQDGPHPTRASFPIRPASLRRGRTWQRALRRLRRNPRYSLARIAALGRAPGVSSGARLKSLAAFVKSLAWADDIRAAGFTHLHAHWATYPTVAARTLSDLTGIPFSFAFHAYDIFATRIQIPENVARAAFAVVNCRYTRDHVLRSNPDIDPAKLVLIYNSLDLNRYRTLPRAPDPAAPVILAVGQLVPTKGFAVLIDAVAGLRADGCNARLVIAGAGPLRRRLAAAARQRGIAQHVAFRGAQTEEQVRTLLSRAALLAMPCVRPSRGTHDALPNVIIEALAAGVPVVASDVFGIPEAIVHEHTGLLAPERDPAALKAALRRVLSDPGAAARFAAAGQQRAAELFDAERNGATLMALFTAGPARPAARRVPPAPDRQPCQ